MWSVCLPQMVEAMERAPFWAGLEAMTHTLPYDLALTAYQGVPADELARITVPVLVLGGGNSPDWFHQACRPLRPRYRARAWSRSRDRTTARRPRRSRRC